MKRSLSTLFFITSVSLFATLAYADEVVEGPRGWEETRNGDIRVVTNGNAVVNILPWQSLEGLTIEQWLHELKQRNPMVGTVLSSGDVKEDRVPGTFAVLRKVDYGDSEGSSILYGCPGQPGHARLMTLDVKDGSLVDMYKGAMFGEEVCKNEPKGAGPSGKKSDKPDSSRSGTLASGLDAVEPAKHKHGDDTKTAIESSVEVTEAELATLNQQIPEANRPTDANLYSRQYFKGFPATLTFEVLMVLKFPDGTELACSNWDPAGNSPGKEARQSKDCLTSEYKKTRDSGLIKSFKAGERVDLSLGTINAMGIDGVDSSSSSIGGGSLVMNKNGEIAIGSFNTASFNSSGAFAASGKSKRVRGRYYLDGHTITIVSTEDEVVHGFIGYDRDDDGKIDLVFLNGTHYWDRSKS